MLWKTTEYTGWGRVLRATGDIARPEKLAALKALWKSHKAPAIGNRRSYGDTALNNGGKVIDMTRLNRLIAFDAKKGILEAEAGITIGEIMRIFAPKGWIPAVMPGTGNVTLGGCIANDVHGKNHAAGSFGQHVLSLTLMCCNGRTQTVTVKETPELFRATLGGLGQTGLIQTATIKMIRASSEVMDVREARVDGLTEFLALLDSSTATYCVGWIDATASGSDLGRGIIEEAEISGATPALPSLKPKSVPFSAPKFTMSSPLVRLFNYLYLRRVPIGGRRITRTMQDFFYPLDRVKNATNLYGKGGFHQFQCALPMATAPETLARMLDLIATAKLASPLTVLKRLGAGRAGMMSFPLEGYSFAVDFQNRIEANGLITELEELTMDAGGRIYLAKDSLAKPEMIIEMYDELSDFAKATNKVDPKHHLVTDMVRRLNLRGEKS